MKIPALTPADLKRIAVIQENLKVVTVTLDPAGAWFILVNCRNGINDITDNLIERSQ